MAILRILGGSTILENNVVQTIASAGEAVAAGAIFTFPALVILGGVRTLPYVEVTALCVVGATMGSLLVVFLRRAYIVEERLPFPEGVACAQVLRAGDAQANVRPLVVGGIDLSGSESAAGRGGNYSRRGLGRAMGRRRGGGRVAGYFGGAARRRLHHRNQDRGAGVRRRRIRVARRDSRANRVPWRRELATPRRPRQQLWSGQVRYLGVGAMLTGGVVTLWKLRTRIASAIGDSIRIVRSQQASSPRRARTPIFRRARC